MGYELETTTTGGATTRSGAHASLAHRWERADERLALALREYAAVRRIAARGEPAWIEAQLKLAEARLRWRQCAEEAEQLADGPELFR